MTFALVLRKDEKLPVVDIGRDVARALGRPLADVTRMLRRSRGVIAIRARVSGCCLPRKSSCWMLTPLSFG